MVNYLKSLKSNCQKRWYADCITPIQDGRQVAGRKNETKDKGYTMTKFDCTAEEFVAAWLPAENTVDDVACMLGMEIADVRSFAGTLRLIGVKLPSKRRGRRAVDHSATAAKLNAMIDAKSLAGKTVQ